MRATLKLLLTATGSNDGGVDASIKRGGGVTFTLSRTGIEVGSGFPLRRLYGKV